MNIVRAKSGDYREISLLRHLAIQGVSSSEYSSVLLASNSPEGVLEELEEETVFALIDGDKFVATVSLDGNQISGLYVHRDYSGKGIGKKLLNYIEGYCKKEGVGEVYLYSTKDSFPFYYKNGYQPVELAYSFNTKKPLVFIRMKKTL
ncbi:GNAT family N-acetyltransferase [archaeon]|nr:GNAT family N-acetyltransferase [archaeon]